jgi:hypothetical protein
VTSSDDGKMGDSCDAGVIRAPTALAGALDRVIMSVIMYSEIIAISWNIIVWDRAACARSSVISVYQSSYFSTLYVPGFTCTMIFFIYLYPHFLRAGECKAMFMAELLE